MVLRYRLELESRKLSPSTINLRLAAVRRLAYEAADTGLLSPELAAGIRRVKGAKRVGVRLGNWLSAEQVRILLRLPNLGTMRGKRDRAIIAVLVGCGLRRSEVAQLKVEDVQMRDDRWVIADLYGKCGHIRTVPVPDWVKAAVDCWTAAPKVTVGRIFRCVNKTGAVWGEGITEKVIWCVVKEFATKADIGNLAPHDLRPLCPIVPRGRRRAGADPIPSGPRERADDREIPRVQTETARRSERPHRHRTRGLTPHVIGASSAADSFREPDFAGTGWRALQRTRC